MHNLFLLAKKLRTNSRKTKLVPPTLVKAAIGTTIKAVKEIRNEPKSLQRASQAANLHVGSPKMVFLRPRSLILSIRTETI